MSNSYNLERVLLDADLLIGAVLIPGVKTPRLVTKKMLKLMRKGPIIVDVAVDQGGCVETTHPTTQRNPIFETEEVIHYRVSNMPGAYPENSTFALTDITFPYLF